MFLRKGKLRLRSIEGFRLLASPHLELGFEKRIHELEREVAALESQSNEAPNARETLRTLKSQLQQELRDLYEKLDPSDIVKVARHSARPQTLDYIELVFDEFIELHGDRCYGDDRAMVTGFAKLEDQKVLVVGQHKGRTIKEKNECYYGCAHPEGYRKALLKMELAAKFRLPIICLIDTPGAYPGIGAEERGQASSIAINLRELSLLRTPIVCVVIGEGGSGGALGIGIGDHIAVLQFAYYSVISPEGCAGILWKDGRRAAQAARALKFTSADLLRMQIVDEVIAEPLGGAHRDHRAMAASLKQSLQKALRKLSGLPNETLLARRYQKFRKIGAYEELAQMPEKERPATEPPRNNGSHGGSNGK
jgi:acetyl-CoA carboxylase carboxyl transferase subunit alpha